MTHDAHTSHDAPPPKRAPFPWFTAFLLVACAVLAVQVVILSRQVRQLKAGTYPLAPHAALEDELKPGTNLDTLQVVDQSGAPQRIFGETRVLLLFTSPQCSYCELAKPHWRELIQTAERSGAKSFALIAGAPPTAESIASIALPCPVYAYLSPATSPMVAMPITPALAIVNSSGQVERSWGGLMTPAQRAAAAAALAAPAH